MSILVIVLKMQTAQHEIIEEYAIVFLILREILMALLVPQVRFLDYPALVYVLIHKIVPKFVTT